MTRSADVDAQAAIESRIRGIGPALAQLRPTAMLAMLAGAALWPVVAPLLGAGVAVGVAGGALGLVSGPGQQAVTDFLARRAGRGAAQEDFERHLLNRMAADTEEAAALRVEIGALLRRVGGVDAALGAASGETREALAGGLSEAAREWREFRWVLADVQSQLRDLQARQAESLVLQRTQLDLQREQLVKTNLLLRASKPDGEIVSLTPRAPMWVAPALSRAPPYKGLEAFEPDDADLFFGRERLLAEVLARLTETSLLALVGRSGSGKSSLLRAGVVASLWKGSLAGSANWPVILMTPGEQPLEELALRVALLRGIAAASLADELGRVPDALRIAAQQALLDAAPGSRLVLVVDQLEELFTLCRRSEVRQRFVDAILGAATGDRSPVVLLLGLRSDFLGRLGDCDGVPAALTGNTALVGPMSDDELTEAIECPCTRAGLTPAPGLVELVLRDVRGAPGALPLVSHALLETWRRREGSTLTLAGYADAGGVGGAIERTAERAYGSLGESDRQIARHVFMRLTGLGDGLDGTRRRASLEELVTGSAPADAVEAVVTTLAGARLLTTGDGSVEIAHEALIRHWPTLQEWLREDRAGLETQRRLSAAARDWHELAREPGALYRGARLAATSEWAARNASALNRVEREFLAASSAAERRELDRARIHARRLRALAATLAILFVVAAASATLAIMRSREADTQRGIAEQQARTATSRRVAAEAMGMLRTSPDTARLLALEAYRMSPSVEARGALVASLQGMPRLRATLPVGRAMTAAAVSHDGRAVATGTGDGRIEFWDPARAQTSGSPLRTGAAVGDVAFGPDRSRLISSGDGGKLSLWDVRRRRLVAERDLGDRVGILDVAFSPTGGHVAAAGSDGRIRLWSADLRPIGVAVEAHAGPVHSVAFDSSGARLVSSGAEDAQVKLWSVTAAGLDTPVEKRISGTGAMIGPGGALVAAVSLGGGLSVEHISRAPRKRRPLTPALALALADAGRTLASAATDGSLRLWDAGTLRSLGPPLHAHQGVVAELAFAGDVLMSTGEDGTVRLWDAARNIPPAVSAVPAALALSPDGTRVVAASSGRVRIVDATTGRRIAGPWRLERGAPAEVGFSPDGMHVAMATGTARIRVSAVDGRPAIRSQPARDLSAFALGPSGQRLATADFASGRLWLLNEDGDPERLRGGLPATALAFSADGTMLADGDFDGSVTVWNTARRMRVHDSSSRSGDSIRRLAFSRDGRLLASVDADGGVRVFFLRSPPRSLTMPERHGGPGRAVAFSADGATLASAGGGSIRLWDVSRGRALGEPLEGLRPESLAFRDGALVAAAGGKVATWEPLLFSRDEAAWRERICRAVGRPLNRREWAGHMPGYPYRPACSR